MDFSNFIDESEYIDTQNYNTSEPLGVRPLNGSMIGSVGLESKTR